MLKIAAYTSPLVAYATPTGVGQHVLGMFSALQRRDDVQFSLITPRGTMPSAQELTGGHPASRLLRSAWPDRALRYATTFAPILNIDRWLVDSEWVYVPAEQPVTTSRRLAVTVHDVLRFESVVPGLPNKPPADLSWRLRMKRILDRANVIATVSTFTKSRIVELFRLSTPERVVVIGNGGAEYFSAINGPDDDDVLQRYQLRPGEYVLFPASLTKRKGGDLLLEVARLAERRSGLTFVVIGRRHDDDLQQQLNRLREKSPGFPVVQVGYVTRPGLAVLYRHARAALFPSRYEGFGIPVVEAIASGCPIFITPHPALLEAAAGRATVIEGDPSWVLHHLEEAQRTGVQNGSASIHTWSDCASRLLSAMRSCPC